MTRSLLGPTVRVVLSRNITCSEPVSVVRMRSLETMSVPTLIVRAAPPGGVPVEDGFTAAALPTFWALAGEGTMASDRPRAKRARLIGGFLIACSSKADERTGENLEVGVGEAVQVREIVGVFDLHAQAERVGQRDFDVG